MPITVQEYLSTATRKAGDELLVAFLRLPEDKRHFAPEGSRSAIDQVAECAILNGHTADLIESRKWSWGDAEFAQFANDKAAVAQDWDRLKTLFEENTAKAAATIAATPEDALGIEIELPWKTESIAEVLAYPNWNMSYHLGQINYIASMLGCLP